MWHRRVWHRNIAGVFIPARREKPVPPVPQEPLSIYRSDCGTPGLTTEISEV